VSYIFAGQIVCFVLIVFTWRKRKKESETFDKLVKIASKHGVKGC